MTTFWTPPAQHFSRHDAVFIIGGGPSIANLTTYERLALRNRQVVAVNNAGLDVVPGADVLFWADTSRWLAWNGNRLWKHVGPFKVTTQWQTDNPLLSVYSVKRVIYRQGIDVSTDPRIVGGCDGGSRAMNLAYHMGARRMVLIGFDMHDDGPQNYHSDHKAEDVEPGRRAREFIPAHEAMAIRFRAMGVEIYNATPNSALTCYPAVRLENWL